MTNIKSHNLENKQNVAKIIALLFDKKNDLHHPDNLIKALIDTLLWAVTVRDDNGKAIKFIGQPYWSKAALKQLKANIENKGKIDKKVSKEDGLVHEHVVPKKVISDIIIKLKDKSVEEIYKILDDLGHVVIITKDEDQSIGSVLKSKMPEGFIYPGEYDVFARYRGTKIEVCDVTGIDFNELTKEKIDDLPTI